MLRLPHAGSDDPTASPPVARSRLGGCLPCLRRQPDCDPAGPALGLLALPRERARHRSDRVRPRLRPFDVHDRRPAPGRPALGHGSPLVRPACGRWSGTGHGGSCRRNRRRLRADPVDGFPSHRQSASGGHHHPHRVPRGGARARAASPVRVGTLHGRDDRTAGEQGAAAAAAALPPLGQPPRRVPARPRAGGRVGPGGAAASKVPGGADDRPWNGWLAPAVRCAGPRDAAALRGCNAADAVGLEDLPRDVLGRRHLTCCRRRRVEPHGLPHAARGAPLRGRRGTVARACADRAQVALRRSSRVPDLHVLGAPERTRAGLVGPRDDAAGGRYAARAVGAPARRGRLREPRFAGPHRRTSSPQLDLRRSSCLDTSWEALPGSRAATRFYSRANARCSRRRRPSR